MGFLQEAPCTFLKPAIPFGASSKKNGREQTYWNACGHGASHSQKEARIMGKMPNWESPRWVSTGFQNKLKHADLKDGR